MSFTNSDTMGHNCPKISHLTYNQSLKYLTPELCTCRSNFYWRITFVSRFALLSYDATFSIFTSPRCMISRIRWKRRRTCLDPWWDLGSLASAIAPLLSQFNGTGSATNRTTPNPIRNLRIQTAYFAASATIIYSTYVFELAIVSCLEDFQLTVPLFKQKICTLIAT